MAVSYIGMGLNPKSINDRLITGLTSTETGFSVPAEENKTSALSLVDGGEVDEMQFVEELASPVKTLCSGEKDESCLVGSVLNNDTDSSGDRQLLPTCVDMSMEVAVEGDRESGVRNEVEECVRRKDGGGDVGRETKEETNYDQCSEESGGRRSTSESTFPYSLPLPVR